MSDSHLEELLRQRLAELHASGASQQEHDRAVAAVDILITEGEQDALKNAASVYRARLADAESARLQLRELATLAGRSGMPVSQLRRLTGMGRITLTTWVKGKTD